MSILEIKDEEFDELYHKLDVQNRRIHSEVLKFIQKNCLINNR